MGSAASAEKYEGSVFAEVMANLENDYNTRKASGEDENEILTSLKQGLAQSNPDVHNLLERVFDCGKTGKIRSRTSVEEGEDLVARLPVGMTTPTKAAMSDSPGPLLNSPSSKWTRMDSTRDLLGIQEACRRYLRKLVLRSSHTYVVAVDGGEAADLCLRVALTLQKGFDRISVLHFYDPENTAKLPEGLRPAALRARYAAELAAAGLPAQRASLDFLEKPGAVDARAAICHYINHSTSIELSVTEAADGSIAYDMGPSFLLVGLRSVDPGDGAARQRAALGSLTDLALRQVTVPTVVVKRAPAEGKEHRAFVVCVDGSDRAWNAYSIVQTLVRPRDRLCLVHVSGAAGDGAGGGGRAVSEDGEGEEEEEEGGGEGGGGGGVGAAEALREKYEADMGKRGTAFGEFVHLCRELGRSVPDMIIEQCVQREADFVVLSPHPKRRLSSVTETIARDGPCNVIICKN